MGLDGMLDLSVVVPIFGCRLCLDVLHARLTSVLKATGLTYELILVDDASPDEAWPVVKELASEDSRVVGIRLSRNYGQHAAITAGLKESRGLRVIVMDCDLQDPPEEIPHLIEKSRAGFDIVYARRTGKTQGFLRRLLTSTYSWIVQALTKRPLQTKYGTFSLITRPVVEAFLRFQDYNRHYLYILNWLGFRSTEICYVHAERLTGESSYSWSRLLRHAASGIFFQTHTFLSWIVYAGFTIALVGIGFAAWFVYRYLFHTALPGWTSLAVLILCIGGLILVSIGVCGLYIGEIFEQVKGRPLYVVSERVSGAPAVAQLQRAMPNPVRPNPLPQ